MSFKAGVFVMFCGFVLMLASCAEESQPAYQPIEVKLRGAADCLSGLGQDVTDYLEGRLSAERLELFWVCTTQTVEDFGRLTRGADPLSYTPSEIRDFLKTFILQDRPLPNELIDGLMALKVVAAGGARETVQKNELADLALFLEDLSEVSSILHPHVPSLLQVTQLEETELDPMLKGLEQGLAQFAVVLSQRGESYAFSDLETLLRGVETWRGPTEGQLLPKLINGLEILSQVKKMLVGAPKEKVLAQQWPPLFSASAHALEVVVRVVWVLDRFWPKPRLILSSPQLPKIAEALRDLKQQGSRVQKQREMSLRDFNDLFALLEKQVWWPKEASRARMMVVLRLVLLRWSSETQPLLTE